MIVPGRSGPGDFVCPLGAEAKGDWVLHGKSIGQERRLRYYNRPIHGPKLLVPAAMFAKHNLLLRTSIQEGESVSLRSRFTSIPSLPDLWTPLGTPELPGGAQPGQGALVA